MTVKDRQGTDVVDAYEPPKGEEVVSPQSAFIVTDVLRENTVRAVNPYWGQFQIRDENGDYRPATLKTGTNNDAKDLNAYGYIAPPSEDGRSNGAYALAVGVWNGNSDSTPVSTPRRPVFSIDVSTYVWDGFLSEASKSWPITRFARPDSGLERVAIDPFTGLLPGPGITPVEEWFLKDTAPDTRLAAGTCGDDVIVVVGVEDSHDNWMKASRDWIRRATRGPGVAGGPDRTRTSYFYNNSFNPYGRTWGALVDGAGCGKPSPSPTCYLVPTPDRPRRDPVVRRALAVWFRTGRSPLPARLGPAQPVAVGGGQSQHRTHGDTHGHAGAHRDAGTDRSTDPGADARADRRTDGDARPDRSPDAGPDPARVDRALTGWRRRL